MLGDNFMWDPDQVIQGETTDTYFQTKGAFEVVSFGFGMTPGDSDSSSTDGTAGSGAGAGAGGGAGAGAGSQQGGRSTAGMNAGLRGGVKMGGSVTRRLGGSMGAGGVSTAGGAGGAGTSGSKPKFGTMTITKVVDNASTTLYQYCSTGDYIPTLNMAVRKSGGDHLLYLQYCFRHNQITTIAWDGGAGDQRPKETLTLEYKAMGMQYVAQDPTGGYTEAPLIWLWSLETGTGNQTLDIGGEPPSEDFLPPIVEPPIVQEDE